MTKGSESISCLLLLLLLLLGLLWLALLTKYRVLLRGIGGAEHAKRIVSVRIKYTITGLKGDYDWLGKAPFQFFHFIRCS